MQSIWRKWRNSPFTRMSAPVNPSNASSFLLGYVVNLAKAVKWVVGRRVRGLRNGPKWATNRQNRVAWVHMLCHVILNHLLARSRF